MTFEFLISGNERGTAEQLLEYAKNVFPDYLKGPYRIARYIAKHKAEEAADVKNYYRVQYWNNVYGLLDVVEYSTPSPDPSPLFKWVDAVESELDKEVRYSATFHGLPIGIFYNTEDSIWAVRLHGERITESMWPHIQVLVPATPSEPSEAEREKFINLVNDHVWENDTVNIPDFMRTNWPK